MKCGANYHENHSAESTEHTISRAVRALIEEAKRVSRRFRGLRWKGLQISGVGAALRVKDGAVFSGPNIDHPDSGPCSMCAECTALSKAFSEGYTEIKTIAAYCRGKILSPCGCCREFLRLFGDPYIIVSGRKKTVKMKLSEIHPLQNE